MPELWIPEIEKKYRLPNAQKAETLNNQATRADLTFGGWVLQKDWVPDFQEFTMLHSGVVLRIRNNTYIEGSGPDWAITLKRREFRQGIHQNSELEADSNNAAKTSAIAEFVGDLCGVEIDFASLAEQGIGYGHSVGLQQTRMYVEKRRREYYNTDKTVSFVIDELPEPAGWFAELELATPAEFPRWEASLGLEELATEHRDYGYIVEDLTRSLPTDRQNHLAF